jgi:hypothetical protein
MAKISLEQALRLSLESTKEYIDDNSRVMNYIILKDQTTGVKYKIYMSNGELIAETIS